MVYMYTVWSVSSGVTWLLQRVTSERFCVYLENWGVTLQPWHIRSISVTTMLHRPSWLWAIVSYELSVSCLSYMICLWVIWVVYVYCLFAAEGGIGQGVWTVCLWLASSSPYKSPYNSLTIVPVVLQHLIACSNKALTQKAFCPAVVDRGTVYYNY